ncbi:hypothetical protein G6F59_016515 [Rhizopus arrhizus]|nr:hypothetical protein G6F59_016515 [Rhizopus arrhizus]
MALREIGELLHGARIPARAAQDGDRFLGVGQQLFQRGASATLAASPRMSSGRAITTGPGRTEVAMWKAREISSGMRSTWSISVTHLACVPNTAR